MLQRARDDPRHDLEITVRMLRKSGAAREHIVVVRYQRTEAGIHRVIVRTERKGVPRHNPVGATLETTRTPPQLDAWATVPVRIHREI
jgi:hypothetical protein